MSRPEYQSSGLKLILDKLPDIPAEMFVASRDDVVAGPFNIDSAGYSKVQLGKDGCTSGSASSITYGVNFVVHGHKVTGATITLYVYRAAQGTSAASIDLNRRTLARALEEVIKNELSSTSTQYTSGTPV